MLGPVSSTDNQLVIFSGTSGKIIKVATGDGLVTATSGVFGTTALASYILSSRINAASGVAGLSASSKLTLSQGQEIWAIADLSDVSGVTGSGTTVVLSTSPTLAGTPVIGDGAGNDKLSFVPEATNPSCGAGAYYIWSNSADLKLKKCENGSITDLAPSGGGSPTIQNNGTDVAAEPKINFIPGTGMSYTIADNGGATRVDVTQGIDTTVVPRFASAGTFTAKQTHTVTGGIAAFKLTEGIAPTTTLTAGDFYVDSTTHKVFHYDGSAFVQLQNRVMTAAGSLTIGGTGGAETELLAGATGTVPYWNGTTLVPRQLLASDITNAYDVSTDQAIGAHFIDVTNIAPPSAPAASHARLYFRTSTGKLACIDNASADCMPASGGGSGTTYKEFIAGTCQLGVAGLTFSVPSSLSPSAVCVTGTNSNYAVASFPDLDGLYSLQNRIWLPSTWTGNIDLAITWRTAGTTGNVAWQLQTACVADAETGDPSWNTAQVITDAAKGTTLQWNTVTQTSITITGCAASEHLLFKFGRDRTDGSDTIGAVTVELISLQFKMTV